MRFLLAPVAALALLTMAVPASAQTTDPIVEVRRIYHDVQVNEAWVDAVLRAWKVCQAPDPDQLEALTTEANELSRQAGGVAPLVGGINHALILEAQSKAETSFWRLTHLEEPAMCYQPPAE